ncbi:unnamed protein product [Lactuca virosa]|uniref:non-specific serine/threonine protein kinase n=1 Tax=Lactuca virosa TaxID=75947 RepID=A0AAU9P771_9ASTR|nr:unnamed protein product [Lactuca virosa]
MSSSLLENAPHDLLYPKLAFHRSLVFTKSTRGLRPLIHLQPSPPLLVLLPLHQVDLILFSGDFCGFSFFPGIIYRDLKPENILLQTDGHVVLSDFDLSFRTQCKPQVIKHPQLKRRRSRSQPPPTFVAEPSTQSNSFVGIEEYIAPEIITGAGHSSAIDWWAVVCLNYLLLLINRRAGKKDEEGGHDALDQATKEGGDRDTLTVVAPIVKKEKSNKAYDVDMIPEKRRCPLIAM